MSDSNRDRIKALMDARLKAGKTPSGRRKPVMKLGGSEKSVLGKVLIAEDDRRVAAVVSGAVAPLRLEPVVTDNGMEAVMFMQVENPLMIILDNRMPQMSGTEACRKIRELPNGLDVPILMITANADRESLKAAIDAGVNDFMAKPLNLAHLQERVRKWVKYDELLAAEAREKDSPTPPAETPE